MAENSHRDEMNAAIRAQRERHAAPRSLAAEPPPPEAPAGFSDTSGARPQTGLEQTRDEPHPRRRFGFFRRN
jgi:hypothetical protein